jgi:hypothetical protein
MPLKEDLLKRTEPFTGFVIIYCNGNKIYEKENYFSKKLNKKCATNWAEIDKNKIASLELHWRGDCKATISKVPSDNHSNMIEANDWFFSHRGYLNMGTRKVVIIARNIGYIENNILHITSVVEETGEILRITRAATTKIG